MRVRSWIESIGVSDCTPSSVSIQRRESGQPQKPSPPRTAIFMGVILPSMPYEGPYSPFVT